MVPFLLLLLLAGSLQAQTHMEVEVTVVDDRQQPLPGADVQLLELSGNQPLKERSDRRGVARFLIDAAGEYEVSVNGMAQGSDPVLVRANEKGSTSLFITYNPALQERTRRQSFDRSGLTDVAVQGQVAPADVAAGHNRIEIRVESSAGERLTGKRVSLVSLAARKRYTAITDASGTAFFHLPGKIAYDIDIEEQLNAGFIIQDGLEGYTLSQTVVYDQYDMHETRRNDTISQDIREPLAQKHSRALYRIHVRRAGQPWANGRIFLDEIRSRNVYQTRTDAKGDAVFILPFGHKYLVHFPYERDVDVVNLEDARNIATGSLDLSYVPNPALEHPERFVPRPGELLLTDFPYYHRIPYPTPATGPALLLRSSDIRPEAVLEIGTAARAGGFAGRPAVNMAFVLDISGSMAGYERIESLKRGLIALLALLRENDIVSITLFNDNARLLLPAQPVGKDRQRIIDLVQGIEPSGGTDMKKALETGYNQAMRFFRAGAANTLVLLSDGYDSNPVDTLLAAQAPWKDKIFCTAIAVGNDYNYELLRRLVTRGADLLQQAHEGSELERLFSEKLLTAGLPMYRDLRIEVRCDPQLQCRQTFSFRNVRLTDGGFDAELPDLFPGQELPALASFVRKGAGKGTYLATVTLSYTDVQTGKRAQRTELLAFSFESEPGVATAQSSEQRKMYTVAFANDCLRRMSAAFEKQQLAEAKLSLDEGQAKIRALYPALDDSDIRALLDKFSAYARALSNVAYKKKMGD
ncbi:hypothetical protein GCM10028786_03820 [Flaviaesturariibacter terrae]